MSVGVRLEVDSDLSQCDSCYCFSSHILLVSVIVKTSVISIISPHLFFAACTKCCNGLKITLSLAIHLGNYILRLVLRSTAHADDLMTF